MGLLLAVTMAFIGALIMPPAHSWSEVAGVVLFYSGALGIGATIWGESK